MEHILRDCLLSCLETGFPVPAVSHFRFMRRLAARWRVSKQRPVDLLPRIKLTDYKWRPQRLRGVRGNWLPARTCLATFRENRLAARSPVDATAAGNARGILLPNQPPGIIKRAI